MTYEAVIGLEVHAQLATQAKLFARPSTAFGGRPNTHVSAFCLGMPGALPVVNRAAVELAVRAAVGLGCTVNQRSQWARKHYFYADLAKGYQITQYEQPIAIGGGVPLHIDGRHKQVGLSRIHMEEDAGKNVHDDAIAGQRSYVDFNRAGVPLIEIVSQPELRSAAEAAEYMRVLRRILMYLGVCDGNMEEGSLRCDANVSLRRVGESRLGTRTELKNLNSFRFIQHAIEYEILRQEQILAQGGAVVQETRLWDAAGKATRPLRSKEEAHDYRYFPDPDLPELVLPDGFVERIATSLPELPESKRQRYTTSLGLSAADADVLVDDPKTAHWFEAALAAHAKPKALANWIINELLGALDGRTLAELPFTPQALAELVALIDDGTISGKIAKDVFADMLTHGGRPKDIVDAKGLRQVSDAGAIEPVVEQVIADNPTSAAQYRQGQKKVLGFLVGQVMKSTGGKANPKLVNELLRSKLEA